MNNQKQDTAYVWGANCSKPPIVVKHSELIRADKESIFRSNCPVCTKGVLLVRRDQTTMKLEAIDFCIGCGQAVEYSDIEELRAKLS